MGMQAARIYFYDGILPMQMVRDKFHELTGLELRLMADGILVESPKAEEELIKKIKEDPEGHYDLHVEFYVDSFYPICFVGYYGDGKSFELECGTEGHYFYRALLKTFFELGIRQVDRKYNRALDNEKDTSDVDISNYLHPYNQNEKIWTDIKRWKDYPETDRPEK